MSKLSKAFDFWRKVSDIALPIVDEALEFKEKPTILSGARMILRLHEHISEIINYTKEEVYPTGFDSDPKWEIVSNDTNIHKVIYAQLITKPHRLEETFKGIPEYHTLICNELEFGLVSISGEEAIYVKKNDEAAYSFLRSLFWDFFGNQVIYSKNEDSKWGVTRAEPLQGFDTSVTKQYIQEIKAYREKGFQRSLLFFGPPGTGKTSASAAILAACSSKTLILPNINEMRPPWFQFNCKLLEPDAVLLEDIDHYNDGNIYQLLSIIEFLNKKNVLLIATCNKICQLDDALIRAGRFDELIEIKNLPEEVLDLLMGGDKEIIDKVRTFPIAAILEVKRRMEVLGREAAFNRIKDLELRVKRSNSHEVYRLEDESSDEHYNEGVEPDNIIYT